MTIEKIVSPSGIHAWLVREHAVPLVALNFAFHGGASQDAAAKAGTANLAADLLDEGAGYLDSKAFHERLENHAIELGFRVGRDYFRGSLRTLNEHRDEAFDLLQSGADQAALRRRRGRAGARAGAGGLAARDHQSEQSRQPPLVADRVSRPPLRPRKQGHAGNRAAHHRRRPARLRRRVFARNELTVSIVGDIDADDRRQADRPRLRRPAEDQQAQAGGGGQPDQSRPPIVIDVNVPQAVVNFGGQGIARHDPDFMAAYIVNHILGGGSFSSRLYKEVREKRGLAYGVSDSLVWFRRAAVVIGGTATRADRTADALKVIEHEIKRMAENGPTPTS